MEILVGTSNPGKVDELRRLLSGLAIEVRTLASIGLAPPDVAETGLTYADNARLKALAYSTAAGLTAIADDSGLELDDFDGWPGPLSARVAGPAADDATRRQLLLDRLAAKNGASRRARFRCTAVIAQNGVVLAESTGTLEGTIAGQPRGEGGFGYDPIFVPIGEIRTVAELSPSEKDRISHRGRAIAALRPFLSARASSSS